MSYNSANDFEHSEIYAEVDQFTKARDELTTKWINDDFLDALRYAVNEITGVFGIPRTAQIVKSDKYFKPVVVGSEHGFYYKNHAEISFTVGKVEKKCECGAESIGYNTHSSWCMKYER